MGVRSIAQLAVLIAAIATPVSGWGQSLNLTQTREVRGVVVEAGTGAPVSGAEVSLHWEFHWPTVSMRPTLDRAVTDASGAFTIQTPMGTDHPFRIHVEGEGIVQFMSGRFDALPAEPLRIEAPSEGGWITGRVVTPEGEAVTDGRVEIRLAEDENLPLELQYLPLDDGGYFTIGPLAIAEYRVRHLYPRPGKPTEYVSVRPVEAGRATEALITLTRALPPVLNVLVLNGEGKPVEQGQVSMQANLRSGIERASYELEAGAREKQGVGLRSGGPGVARFVRLEGGRYVFSAETPEGTGFIETLIEDGTAAADPIVLKLELATASVQGSVKVGGEVTSPPMRVTLSRQVQAEASRLPVRFNLTTEADLDGNFAFERVAPAKYDVQVAGAGGQIEAREEIELREGERRVVTFALPARKTVTIKGAVSDPEGRPITGCDVNLQGMIMFLTPTGSATNHVQQVQRTGEQGEFEFKVLVPVDAREAGPWQVVFSHNEYSSAIRMVNALAGPLEPVAVTLTPKMPVRVEFVAANEEAREELGGTLEFRFDASYRSIGPGTYIIPTRRVVLEDPAKSAIERLLVTRGMPMEFMLHDPNLRIEGPVVWLKDGKEIAQGSYTVGETEKGPLTARVKLAPGRETKRKIHLRVLDLLTGTPLEGVHAEAGGSGANTLPDGTCEVEVSPKATQLRFGGFSIIEADGAEIVGDTGKVFGLALKLTEELTTTAEEPLEVRGVAHTSGRRVQLRIEDSFGNDLTAKVSAIDGRLEWKMPPRRSPSDLGSLCIPHTGEAVHTVYLTLGSGNGMAFEMVEEPGPGVTLVHGTGNSPALRIDFEAMGDRTYVDVKLRVKETLLIPGIDF